MITLGYEYEVVKRTTIEDLTMDGRDVIANRMATCGYLALVHLKDVQTERIYFSVELPNNLYTSPLALLREKH